MSGGLWRQTGPQRAKAPSLTLNRGSRRIPVLLDEETPPMRIIDSHFHWWPRSIFEKLCKRKAYPRASVNEIYPRFSPMHSAVKPNPVAAMLLTTPLSEERTLQRSFTIPVLGLV